MQEDRKNQIEKAALAFAKEQYKEEPHITTCAHYFYVGAKFADENPSFENTIKFENHDHKVCLTALRRINIMEAQLRVALEALERSEQYMITTNINRAISRGDLEKVQLAIYQIKELEK